jgi:hypothetical protein
MAVEIQGLRPTFPVSYKATTTGVNASGVAAGDILRFSTPGTNQYVQKMYVTGSAGDITAALLCGVALRGTGGSTVATDGANTDDAYPIVDGDFIFIDIDARSGNTIGAGNFTADKMYGQVFEFVDAGTLDLTDTTIDVTKIRVKLLYFVSGVGSRYGRAFGQIIIPNLSA